MMQPERRAGRPREPRIESLEAHPRPFVSLAVAAEYLGLHPESVRARVEDGRLRAHRDGKVYRINVADLAAYVAATRSDKVIT